jgi:hypothetical protein
MTGSSVTTHRVLAALGSAYEFASGYEWVLAPMAGTPDDRQHQERLGMFS